MKTYAGCGLERNRKTDDSTNPIRKSIRLNRSLFWRRCRMYRRTCAFFVGLYTICSKLCQLKPRPLVWRDEMVCWQTPHISWISEMQVRHCWNWVNVVDIEYSFSIVLEFLWKFTQVDWCFVYWFVYNWLVYSFTHYLSTWNIYIYIVIFVLSWIYYTTAVVCTVASHYNCISSHPSYLYIRQ